MLISWWETDDLLLYSKSTRKIFRKNIDTEVIQEALCRIYHMKPKQVSVMAGNLADLNGKTIKYYQGTATEESQIPWYAIQKNYFEKRFTANIQEVLLLFFVYSKENILTVYYDMFQTDQIPTQWQLSEDQTLYRINYRLRENSAGQKEFFKLLQDGSERVMKVVEKGIKLAPKKAGTLL